MNLRCNICAIDIAGDDVSHRHEDLVDTRPIVVEVPLDAHGPRCGHCGEYVDREGPTFCAACERRTTGRRTD